MTDRFPTSKCHTDCRILRELRIYVIILTDQALLGVLSTKRDSLPSSVVAACCRKVLGTSPLSEIDFFATNAARTVGSTSSRMILTL